MENVALFDITNGDSPAKIVPIDGECIYDISQIPLKFGFQFPSSGLICIDGDSLSEAIRRAATAARNGSLAVCHSGLEDFDNYPYTEIRDVEISLSLQAVINGADGCSRTFMLTAKYGVSDEGSAVMVEVDASRGKFIVQA